MIEFLCVEKHIFAVVQDQVEFTFEASLPMVHRSESNKRTKVEYLSLQATGAKEFIYYTMQHHILLLLAILLSSASYSAGQQVLQLKDEPCQNYEEISAALLDAKSAWVDPDCYDFTYTFTGFQIGQPEPQSVRVRNGVAENGEKTIDDFFTMIESLCVEGCPNVGAARCEMEFAMEGYPMSIFIDVNQYQPDNRRAYIIEDFNFVVCEPTDDNDGEPEESPQQRYV